MAVAAAEQTFFETLQTVPQALAVAELPQDEMTRRRAARFIGSLALQPTAQVALPESVAQSRPIESLYEALRLAAEGDAEALSMVETNVRTDVIERTIKSGHVMKVDLLVDEAGRIQQHGQSLESIQANSLRYAAGNWQMRERIEAETRNAFRIEEKYRAGDLETHYFVVLSRAADNMSTAEMAEVGFFTDTMSCAVQVTTVENGRLTTESAFVAGTGQSDGQRYDGAAVAAVAADFGIDLRYKTATEVLDSPLLIPKQLMPNGVIDLVQRYDQHAGGTFFGEAKSPQNYLTFRQSCREREWFLQPKIAAIRDDLIAALPAIHGPLEAAQMLNYLSGSHMIEQAVFDTTINPRVFGLLAAREIERSRAAFARGDNEQGLQLVTQAKKFDASSSCPGGLKSGGENSLDGGDSRSDEVSDEDCEFVSKQCPVCHKKNVKTTVTKHMIKGDCGCSKRK